MEKFKETLTFIFFGIVTFFYSSSALAGSYEENKAFFEQFYSSKDPLMAASAIAVKDQLPAVIDVLNEGTYRCPEIFSVNGKIDHKIEDIYVKNFIQIYPGAGGNSFGPYEVSQVYAYPDAYRFSINILLQDCTDDDLDNRENIYYPFIKTVISANQSTKIAGFEEYLKQFLIECFGDEIARDWDQVVQGKKPVVVTKNMILGLKNDFRSAHKRSIEHFLNRTRSKRETLSS